jgi:hypothetical protein
VLNQLVAFFLVVLSVAPFTAPFSTYDAGQISDDRDAIRSIAWHAPREAAPHTDPSALTVPPLTAHDPGSVGRPVHETVPIEVQHQAVSQRYVQVRRPSRLEASPPHRLAVLRL